MFVLSVTEGNNRSISLGRVLTLMYLTQKQVKVKKSYPAIHAFIGLSCHLPLSIAALCQDVNQHVFVAVQEGTIIKKLALTQYLRRLHPLWTKTNGQVLNLLVLYIFKYYWISITQQHLMNPTCSQGIFNDVAYNEFVLYKQGFFCRTHRRKGRNTEGNNESTRCLYSLVG